MTSDSKETSVKIQDVNCERKKYIRNDKEDPSRVAKEGQLPIPASSLNFISDMQSTRTLMDISVRGVGVGLTRTENSYKKIKNSKRNS